jgi:hypothetical protein
MNLMNMSLDTKNAMSRKFGMMRKNISKPLRLKLFVGQNQVQEMWRMLGWEQVFGLTLASQIVCFDVQSRAELLTAATPTLHNAWYRYLMHVNSSYLWLRLVQRFSRIKV